jgi:hypothetical protein
MSVARAVARAVAMAVVAVVVVARVMDYFPRCTYLPMKNLGSKKKKKLGTLPR